MTAVGLVSSTGPHDVPGLTHTITSNSLEFMQLCADRPWLGRFATWIMALTARRMPGRLVSGADLSLPAPDARLMSEPSRGGGFATGFGIRAERRSGPQHDTALMVRQWGIDLESIDTPVMIWHREEDLNAPIAMGHFLAERIAKAELNVFPGEGHLSSLAHHGEDILAELVASGYERDGALMTDRGVAVGFLYHAGLGKVLLHLRGSDAPPNAGKWAFFGGRTEPEDGGDLLVTWCREIREELGIGLDPKSVISLRNGTYDDGTDWHDFYCEWHTTDDQFVLTEGQRYAWFTLDEAIALNELADYARESLLVFRERLESVQ